MSQSENKTMPEIKLSDEDFKKFEGNINNPPEPNEMLVNAVKSRKTMPEAVELFTNEQLSDIKEDCMFWANNCGGCETCAREFKNPPLYNHQETVNLILMIEALKSERERAKLQKKADDQAIAYMGEKITALTAECEKLIKNSELEAEAHMDTAKTLNLKIAELTAECEYLQKDLKERDSHIKSQTAAMSKLESENADFRAALEFYADRNNWKCWDSHSDCKDVITISDLGVKSYSEKADYAIPSGGRRAIEVLRKHETKPEAK